MKRAPKSPLDPAGLADRLKVLAEPRRLRILNLLMEGVQCNCELGDALEMAPNLISHHLSVLRQAGLVEVTRDAVDARWIYYSINRAALQDLNAVLGAFFDPARIRPRRPACGPQGTLASCFASNDVNSDFCRTFTRSRSTYEIMKPEDVGIANTDLVLGKHSGRHALKQRIAGGEDFGELAKKHSNCPSGKNCGDLGWFRKGQMVPEFEKAAFEGKKGDVVGPVKTQFGYHLIRINDQKD